MHADTCPDRDHLASFVLGTLAEQEAEQVGEHLTTCAQCAATVETLDGVEDSVVMSLREAGSGSESRFVNEPEFEEALGHLRRLGPACLPDGPIGVVVDTDGLPERLGEFQILGRLGQGGMGAVYRARHLRLGKTVAIKVLPRDRLEQPEAKARFDREMLAVGQLEHANIVRAYDGREIDGQPVLVMEYVEGIDLSKLVTRLGPLPVPEACELTRQAAVGLEVIHEHGLVHRDIKPSNLMLSWSGKTSAPVVKILDLGLARLHADDRPADDLTSEGRPMGTADYISPEQATSSHDVDIRSDLYSLGCTLYKLLAGRAPFDVPGCRQSVQKLAAHLRDRPAPIRSLRADVPEELAAVLDKLLAKTPPDRYGAPEELAEALAPLAAGADLAAIVRRALQSASAGSKQARGLSADATTDPFVKSAYSSTDAGCAIEAHLPVAAGLFVGPGRAQATAPKPRPLPQRATSPLVATYRSIRKPRVLIALMVAPVAAFLGVIIWINNHKIEAPDGSQVRVEGDKVTITLPSGKESRPDGGTSSEGGRGSGATGMASPVQKTDLRATLLPASDLQVDKPLRPIWQTVLKRPWRQEICRVKLAPDGKQLVVFHFTASQRCPIEKLDAQTGRLMAEHLLAFHAPNLATTDGWVDHEGNLYVMSSLGRSVWKLDPGADQTIWHFTGGGPSFETAQSVITDAAGFVYASGYCGSFYPRGSRAVKLGPSGSPLWEKDDRYGGGTDCYPELALDSHGNLFRGGRDQTDPDDSTKDRGRIIGHRAVDGAEILNITVEESNSRVSGLAIDSRDGLYVAYMHDLYAGPHEGGHRQRAVVQKRDLQGKVLWEYRFPEPGTCFGRGAIRLFGDDGLLMTCQKWSADKSTPSLALLGLDGKLRWTAEIHLTDWDAARGVIDARAPRIYLGLTNTSDSGLTRVVCLEASTTPGKDN